MRIGIDCDGVLRDLIGHLSHHIVDNYPEHANKIQGIRTRAMLDDLMANDPVISGYERDEVLQAFNHLSELAPQSIMTSNMLTKSLMRKYLEQGQMLDTFDVDQLLGAENKLNQSAVFRRPARTEYPKN